MAGSLDGLRAREGRLLGVVRLAGRWLADSGAGADGRLAGQWLADSGAGAGGGLAGQWLAD